MKWPINDVHVSNKKFPCHNIHVYSISSISTNNKIGSKVTSCIVQEINKDYLKQRSLSTFRVKPAVRLSIPKNSNIIDLSILNQVQDFRNKLVKPKSKKNSPKLPSWIWRILSLLVRFSKLSFRNPWIYWELFYKISINPLPTYQTRPTDWPLQLIRKEGFIGLFITLVLKAL